VVKPRGRAELEPLDEDATNVALEITELREEGTPEPDTTVLCIPLKLAPKDREYDSSRDTSGEPPLAEAKCCAAADPYRLL